MSVSVLQIGSVAAPLAAGDLAESTTALALALAELEAPVAVLTLLSPQASPPAGFARRLSPLLVGEEALEVFEGSLARRVRAWLLRAPAGLVPTEALRRATAAAVQELDLAVEVAHAHGAEAVAALDEIGRVRPSAVRVATIDEPGGADAVADAVVVPAVEAEGGALAIAPGIDTASWNPETDGALPARFSAEAPEGKFTCRRALQRRLGLAPRDDVALLSTLSPAVQDRLTAALGQERAAAAQALGPSAGVSLRELLAASDFVVLDEQDDAGVLRALRYGAIPLVRDGGRASARIVEYDEPSRTGQGLLFTDETLADCVFRASRLHADAETMAGLRRRALDTDVSWRGPARRYLELFDRLSRE